MDVLYRSASAPGCANLDLVLAAGDAVVVLDGVTPDDPAGGGCAHGVAWYVRRLGVAVMAALLADEPGGEPLAVLLEDAIAAVRDDHASTCDLAHPHSPSATVALLRRTAGTVDCLVLGDCAVVLTAADGSHRVVVDDRLDRLRPADAAQRARLRNRPDGFWVAGTAPEAAWMSYSVSQPAARLRRVTLLTDGGYRLVADYGWPWADLVKVVADDGPGALIARTREAETAQPVGGPGRKRHDDATVVTCDLGGSEPRRRPADRHRGAEGVPCHTRRS